MKVHRPARQDDGSWRARHYYEGYGTALLGYHYYTWAFIGFSAAIVLIAILLLFDGQFIGDDSDKPAAIGWFGRCAVWLVIALVALNVISTLLECGLGACPDNPTTYHLLKLLPWQ
jgi:uncharacterized membrane protein